MALESGSIIAVRSVFPSNCATRLCTALPLLLTWSLRVRFAGTRSTLHLKFLSVVRMILANIAGRR